MEQARAYEVYIHTPIKQHPIQSIPLHLRHIAWLLFVVTVLPTIRKKIKYKQLVAWSLCPLNDIHKDDKYSTYQTLSSFCGDFMEHFLSSCCCQLAVWTCHTAQSHYNMSSSSQCPLTLIILFSEKLKISKKKQYSVEKFLLRENTESSKIFHSLKWKFKK